MCHVVVAGTEVVTPTGRKGFRPVDPYIALVCFPVIFMGELPDKTMFASLVMATKGRPRQVWLGAAGAFVVHVAIATTLGVALFAILPKRALNAVVAAMFLFGALYAWREGTKDEGELTQKESSKHGAVLTAFVVIFVAEWGDLTQILTANLAAKYNSPLSVAIGSIAALWTVAALAVASGQTLLRYVNISTIRKITAVVLVALAAYVAWTAPSADARSPDDPSSITLAGAGPSCGRDPRMQFVTYLRGPRCGRLNLQLVVGTTEAEVVWAIGVVVALAVWRASTIPTASVQAGVMMKATPPKGPAMARSPKTTDAHDSQRGKARLQSPAMPVANARMASPAITGTKSSCCR